MAAKNSVESILVRTRQPSAGSVHLQPPCELIMMSVGMGFKASLSDIGHIEGVALSITGGVITRWRRLWKASEITHQPVTNSDAAWRFQDADANDRHLSADTIRAVFQCLPAALRGPLDKEGLCNRFPVGEVKHVVLAGGNVKVHISGLETADVRTLLANNTYMQSLHPAGARFDSVGLTVGRALKDHANRLSDVDTSNPRKLAVTSTCRDLHGVDPRDLLHALTRVLQTPCTQISYVKSEFRASASWSELKSFLGVDFTDTYVCTNGLQVKFGNPVFKMALLPRSICGVTMTYMELRSRGGTMAYTCTRDTKQARKDLRAALARGPKTQYWERLCSVCLQAFSCRCIPTATGVDARLSADAAAADDDSESNPE